MERASIYAASRAFGLTWHRFPVFELHYAHRGNLTWELRDGSRLRIRGGNVTILAPNTEHRSLYDFELPAVTLGFAVFPNAPSPSPPFATPAEQADAFRILRKAGTRVVSGCPGLDAEFCALHDEVRRLVAEPRLQSPMNLGLARSRLHKLFYLLLRSLTAPRGKPHYTPVRVAIRHMERHLADNLSADAITIASIADRLGFSSSSTFSRRFSKHFGITPTEYRHQTLRKLRESR